MRKRSIFGMGIVFILVFIQSKGQHTKNASFDKARKFTGNVATGWMGFLTDLLRRDAIPPPGCLRIYAYTGLALYESQVPALDGYQSLYTYFSGNKIPALEKTLYHSATVANAAVAELVRKMAILKSQKEIDSLESVYQINLQQETSIRHSNASIIFGRQIAEAIFNWSKTDGTFVKYSSFPLKQAPELWQPDPNSPNPPIGAYQGLLRTFIKDVVSVSVPPPPPVYSTDSSSFFYRSASIVFESRNKVSAMDSILIVAWQNKYGINNLTMGHLTMLLTSMMNGQNYPLEKAAILYAKNGIAMFDAVVASFSAIYTFSTTRPLNYIRTVMGKTDWNTIYPYNFYPSYPSNFAACVSASAAIMSNAFGELFPVIDSTQVASYGVSQFSSINDFVNRVANCRVLAGIEFPFAMEEGKTQGKIVGELANSLPFKKSK